MVDRRHKFKYESRECAAIHDIVGKATFQVHFTFVEIKIIYLSTREREIYEFHLSFVNFNRDTNYHYNYKCDLSFGRNLKYYPSISD